MINTSEVVGDEPIAFTVYFSKAQPDEYQIIPIPDDLDNWHPYEVTNISEVSGKKYDVATGNLVASIPSNKSQLYQRKQAYASESDPLFLAAQYDAVMGTDPDGLSMAVWCAKVTEIKNRYPLTEE